jgi:cytoplasmic iron level regulating protein YaaA (DUF328/UPF0246 family)
MPPSESKILGGSGLWDPDSGSFKLGKERRLVIEAINNRTIRGVVPPGEAARAAGERYAGVVWMHMGVEDLCPGARTRAEERMVIVSGLGGLFAWGDPTPYYKLKMGASLSGIGKLSRFWADYLPKHLSNQPVIDLLALEQSVAVPVPEGDKPWWRVELMSSNGQRSGHHGKAAKGRLARELCMTDDPFGLLKEYRDEQGWLLHITKIRE